SEAYPQDAEGVFRYYQYTDVSDASVFEDYVDQVQKAALYDTGAIAVYGDGLLTLSTCSYHTKRRAVCCSCTKRRITATWVKIPLTNLISIANTGYIS
ncbi:MAG: hypothetical protein ACOYBH_09890, partial [Candidatus Alectryocaccobium sp.]